MQARNFYQGIKKTSNNISSCKDEEENLLAGTEHVLRLWKEHFYTLLTSNVSGEDVSIIDYGVVCTPSNQDQVKVAISRLKNNK